MTHAFHFYDEATGIFSGRYFIGPAHEAEQERPAGHGVFVGAVDPRRVRVDLATGQLVPHQPPAPSDDELQTWRWDAEAWRWVSEPTAAALARDARAERARRLLACDWTQLPDVPAWTAQAWAAYRQALRDITAQPGFPISITWPEEPTP
jgi:hypothetical protein